MDDNNQKNNQLDNNLNTDDYQKILDEYAASVKPEDNEAEISPPEEADNPVEPTAKLEDVASEQEKLKLKDTNSLQLEAPDAPLLPPVISDIKNTVSDPPVSPIAESIDKTSQETTSFDPQPHHEDNQSNDSFQPKSESEPSSTTNISDNKEINQKTPEEIKAEIDKILSDDSGSPSKISPSANSFRSIFIFSLLIFLVVAGAWAYFLFYPQSVTNLNSTKNLPSPTQTIQESVCNLDSKVYQVGDSFSSSDGCNTCTCQPNGAVACTEMACIPAPEASSSSNSALIKSTISPNESTSTSILKE